MSKKKPPTNLQRAGRALWLEVSNSYELRPDELAVLHDACRTADIIDAMESAWASQGFPMTSKGSMGQEVAHPFLSELRQYRSARASLLKQLRLPDGGESADDRSSKARDAANARWSRRGA